MTKVTKRKRDLFVAYSSRRIRVQKHHDREHGNRYAAGSSYLDPQLEARERQILTQLPAFSPGHNIHQTFYQLGITYSNI